MVQPKRARLLVPTLAAPEPWRLPFGIRRWREYPNRVPDPPPLDWPRRETMQIQAAVPRTAVRLSMRDAASHRKKPAGLARWVRHWGGREDRTTPHATQTQA